MTGLVQRTVSKSCIVIKQDVGYSFVRRCLPTAVWQLQLRSVTSAFLAAGIHNVVVEINQDRNQNKNATPT